MKIKSGVYYWLALACGGVGMLYGLGFAGAAEALGVLLYRQAATAGVLLGSSLLFMRLGNRAQAREEAQRRRYYRRLKSCQRAAEEKNDSHSA